MTTARRGDTFWHWMAMIFFRLQRKWAKMKLFFEIAKPVPFQCAVSKSWLVEIFFFPQNSDPEKAKICQEKSLKLMLILTGRYTAHFTWDFNSGNSVEIQAKKKKRGKETFYNKSLVENCEIPWRRKWQPTAVFLPGESHGQSSLVGYSPRGRRVRRIWLTKQHEISVCLDLCLPPCGSLSLDNIVEVNL